MNRDLARVKRFLGKMGKAKEYAREKVKVRQGENETPAKKPIDLWDALKDLLKFSH